MPRTRPARRAPVLVAAVLSLLLAAPAAADPITIASDPLTIHVGERGQLQAMRTGDAGGMFFPPLLTTGDAGLFLAFPAAAAAPPPAAVAGRVFGFQGGSGPTGLEDYSLDRQDDVIGSGTAADPYVQLTIYGVPGAAQIRQTTSYVAGEDTFAVQWAVQNVTSAPLAFKAVAAADLFIDGSDRGTGIYTDGPPRFVGSTNAETGRSGGFEELRTASEPWSHYEATAFGTRASRLWGKVAAAAEATTPTFADTVLGALADDAVGVEWDGLLTVPLAAGETTRFALTVRSPAPAAFQLTPPNAGSPEGVPIAFTATARDGTDAPYAGRTVRFSIVGANPGSGEAVTDADGHATLVDPGTAAGSDTLIAYVDLDGDATRDPVEPQASAVASFVDRTAPVCSARVRDIRPAAADGSAPLVVRLRCRERAAVTARPALRLPGARGRQLRLGAVRATVTADRPTSVRVPVPAAVRGRYAGATVTAVVRVTARDVAGNTARTRATRRLRLP